MRTASQEMSWGSLAPATVILGGAGLIFLGGAGEMASRSGHGWGSLSAVALGLGIWGVLAALYWLNWRAAKFRALQSREPWRQPKPGGFLMGGLLGFVGVLMLHAAAFIAMTVPGELQLAAAVVALNPLMLLAYTVVPLLTGWVFRAVRATSLA